jgi:serine/threonine protein kinase
VVGVLHPIDGGESTSSPLLASAVERFEASAADGSLVIGGRFEVIERLGQPGMGGSGSVYKAFDRTLDRFVAIKVMAPSELLEATREAQTLARMRHRNVVAIHDYGSAPGYRYLVLEFLVGRDLRQWLREQPSTSEILARSIAAGRGLAAAHAAGLVHRDVKPSNVIMTDDGRAVVIDFSLARNLDTLDGPSEFGRLEHVPSPSSLAYLAPERIGYDAGDERSDQFAFCVMLWEALTGRLPFPLDEGREAAIERGPGALAADVPEHVGWALRRGLSPSPARRFHDMTELLDHLERPVARPQRRRRRPLVMAALAVTAFALGLGLAPDPMIETAVSDAGFNPGLVGADIVLERAKGKLAVMQTAGAKADFDALTQYYLEHVDEGSPAYCRFAAEIEPFADAMLAADDLPLGRPLYTRAIKFGEDCRFPRAAMEQLEGKKRSAREAFLTRKAHEVPECRVPPNDQSYESGESFQWTSLPE